jgi:hypothetical protein
MMHRREKGKTRGIEKLKTEEGNKEKGRNQSYEDKEAKRNSNFRPRWHKQ